MGLVQVLVPVGDVGAALVDGQLALEAADAADGAVLAGDDVEVVAVAVGADALLALVLDALVGVLTGGAVLLDLLGGGGQVLADLGGAVDEGVVHQGRLGPGHPLVVDDLPAGGHGLELVLGLDVRAPVGAADADVGDGLGAHDGRVRDHDALGGGAALGQAALGDLRGDEVVAGVHAGPEAVHDGVEQAGGAGLEDRVDHDDAVGTEHLEGQPVKVVLVDAHVLGAAHEHLDAGDAAGAVLDVKVHRADELDLAAGLLGGQKHSLADGVVVAVLGAKRDAHDLGHGDPFPLRAQTVCGAPPRAGRLFTEKRRAKAVMQTHREPGQAETGRCAG